MFAIVIAASVATYIAQSVGRAVATQTNVPIGDRFANAAISCVVYIQQTFWPTNLAPFYPHPRSIPGGRVDLALAGVCAAAVALGCAAAWLWRRRAPWFFVGWFWYLGTLVPVIGIVQVGEQAHADRYTYIPTIGLAIAAAWSVAAAGRRWPETRVPIAAATTLALLSLAILTHRQIGFWRDAETLWRHGTAVVADSYVGHNNLGEALEVQGRHHEALDEFRKTLAIDPNDALALSNTGVVLIRLGREQEAKDYLKRSIQRDPSYAQAYVHLGNIYARENRPDEAIMLYRQSIQRKPDFANGYHNLAVTLAQKGEYADAIDLWRKGLLLRPDDADMHHHLGVALVMTGRTAEGLDELRSALAIAPNRADTLMRLAWVLSTHPRADVRDPSRAVEFARRAVELAGHKNVEALDTLAASEAAAGHFGRAASAAEAALQLVPSADQSLRASIQQRLDLYRAGKPFVQTRRRTTSPATKPS
jgi:Tfp pilus assembly protein PilF